MRVEIRLRKVPRDVIFRGRHSILWTIFWQAQDTGFVRLSSRLGFITGIPGDNFVWQVRYFGCLRFSFRGKTKTVETSAKKHLKPSRWSIVSYIFNFHVSWCSRNMVKFNHALVQPSSHFVRVAWLSLWRCAHVWFTDGDVGIIIDPIKLAFKDPCREILWVPLMNPCAKILWVPRSGRKGILWVSDDLCVEILWIPLVLWCLVQRDLFSSFKGPLYTDFVNSLQRSFVRTCRKFPQRILV